MCFIIWSTSWAFTRKTRTQEWGQFYVLMFALSIWNFYFAPDTLCDLTYDLWYFVGIRDAFDPKAVLQLIPVGVGEVKIQGLESGLYLAMNSKGNLYAEPDDSNDATVFLESSSGVVCARSLVFLLVKYWNWNFFLPKLKTLSILVILMYCKGYTSAVHLLITNN